MRKVSSAAWVILRNKKKNKSNQSRRDQLGECIHEIYDEEHQIYGAKKIKSILTERGEFTIERMVTELMQEMNLSCIRETAKKVYKAKSGKKKEAPYSSNNFRTLLQSLDVKQPFSPSGKPCHNAVMDLHFSSMKKEELYRMNYRFVNELKG